MEGMSQPTAPPTHDPRIGCLIRLVQGVMTEYTNLATRVLPRLDDNERAEALAHVQKVAQEAADAITEIVNTETTQP